jgi:hypothetical protein
MPVSWKSSKTLAMFLASGIPAASTGLVDAARERQEAELCTGARGAESGRAYRAPDIHLGR